ncbi:expressed unknown protein [Seminavis robusta]|uniref:CCHC-type domain-containing protein n=1 Tax=Seminavis robusta TaxID=568900 RepID=A0A9N8ETF2_9STRA|nr:expressed unknown protein [Seminavis robusta]|eukprot:Sro1532_g280220.1 n/a (439) ;mRNA; r:1915-3231
MSDSQEDGVDRTGIDPGSYWRVWTCIETLLNEDEKNRMMMEPYRATTLQVTSILRLWGKQWAGNAAWASVLNKNSLHHEAEECIVALYHLRQWMNEVVESDASAENGFLAVDVCGGKGIFSMMLSYMASEFWQPEDATAATTQDQISRPRHLKKIILLEKATDIDWCHLKEANQRSDSHTANAGISFPMIELWSDTNLHQYDILIERLQALSAENDNLPIAMTGIHLCKMLSPSLAGLVNGLGSQLCPYLCLSPCCLPRVVLNPSSKKNKKLNTPQPPRIIPIHGHETKEARESRLEHNRRKHAARNRFSCYLCKSRKHWVKRCPQYTAMEDDEERQKVMNAALASVPCWICGVVGHFRNDCPNPDAARIVNRNPPTAEMDVSNVITSPSPYATYVSCWQLTLTWARTAVTSSPTTRGLILLRRIKPALNRLSELQRR